MSALDEYGDEQTHLLPKEVDNCILKIAAREGLETEGLRRSLRNDCRQFLPEAYRRLREQLPELFREYHEEQRKQRKAAEEIAALSGSQFEGYLAGILRQSGWEVAGTPGSGDQGADLIIRKGRRKVVVQAKRYSGAVGNKAVQEVVAAMKYYGAAEGRVVSSSTFTPQARDLAQRCAVRLVEGSELDRLGGL